MARDAGIVTGIVITAQDEKNIPNTAGSDHLVEMERQAMISVGLEDTNMCRDKESFGDVPRMGSLRGGCDFGALDRGKEAVEHHELCR